MKEIVTAIDSAIAKAQSDKHRGHLGASQIGARCARQTWYVFHWYYSVKHTGRILRLFDRGNEEETRFIRYLRAGGFEVRDHSKRLMYHSGSDSYISIDWEDDDQYVWSESDDVSQDSYHIQRAKARNEGPRQWGFSMFGGHFAGSADAKISGFKKYGLEGWGLAEFKTHSDKSFKMLQAKGVQSSKPTHYVQMQIYMAFFDLPWAMYLAVNKNDDTIYCEVVYYREEIAQFYIDRAASIITVNGPPERLTNDASWFECKYCDFREHCHYNKKATVNCRSCVYAKPMVDRSDQTWYCDKWKKDIPSEFLSTGCEAWEPYS